MRGLWVSVFDVFWVLFFGVVVVLGGGFLVSGFHCVCVCVCVCVRARGLAHLVYLQERKNILTNVKKCRECKLIRCVSEDGHYWPKHVVIFCY